MIQDLRENYDLAKLEREDLNYDPFVQFKNWFDYAVSKEVTEPNAMTVATVTADGRPSARIVLLKGFDEKGFVFYTNYNSLKGQELQQNPNTALVFCWLDLHKQIRIEGKVQKLSPQQSTEYFQSRPKGSQIGAWASPQSSVIKNRDILEENTEALKAQYADAKKLPRPENWGGFLVKPTMIEFWQGRTSRLHDRLRYTLEESGGWKIERLAP
ncbi:MAG: pyridoxamine 5'-phosphate oxidase [Saprospiraceae bacterium]|jgi:pyridoxamine 5'-phosphate oxidase